MITAARIKAIPRPENNVNVSEKHMIPIIVATTGSIVAIIPALLASTLRSPSVYAKNGITAVTRAVSMQKNISPVLCYNLLVFIIAPSLPVPTGAYYPANFEILRLRKMYRRRLRVSACVLPYPELPKAVLP